MKDKDKIFFMERRIDGLTNELLLAWNRVSGLEKHKEVMMEQIKRAYKEKRALAKYHQERIDELRLEIKSLKIMLREQNAK